MNRDDIIKLAQEAGFGDYAYESAGIFARFAAMVASTEREKCTNTQEFVTLPREVVEQAIEAMLDTAMPTDALRAALEHPQNHIEQHLGMVPDGWKLVPVEPTKEMKSAGAFAAARANAVSYKPAGTYIPVDAMALMSYRAMLAAAPQPPALEQPQGDQCKASSRMDARRWEARR